MADRDTFARGATAPMFPPAPKFCTVRNCDNETNLVLVQVRGPEGEKTRAFSDVGYMNRGDPVLREGYDFIRWVGRCWSCYNRERDYADQDWRERALQAEAKRVALTPGRKGETLSEYIARHSEVNLGGLAPIAKAISRAQERVPGSDDDL